MSNYWFLIQLTKIGEFYNPTLSEMRVYISINLMVFRMDGLTRSTRVQLKVDLYSGI